MSTSKVNEALNKEKEKIMRAVSALSERKSTILGSIDNRFMDIQGRETRDNVIYSCRNRLKDLKKRAANGDDGCFDGIRLPVAIELLETEIAARDNINKVHDESWAIGEQVALCAKVMDEIDRFLNIGAPVVVFSSHNYRINTKKTVLKGRIPAKIAQSVEAFFDAINKADSILSASEYEVSFGRALTGGENKTLHDSLVSRCKAIDSAISTIEAAFVDLLTMDLTGEVKTEADRINKQIYDTFVNLRDAIMESGHVSKASAETAANMQLMHEFGELRATIPILENAVELEMRVFGVAHDVVSGLNETLKIELQKLSGTRC